MILKYFEADNIDINKYNLILFHGDNEGAKKETISKIISYNKKKVHKYEEKEILDNKDEFFNKILSKSLFDNEVIYIINRSTNKIKDVIEEIINKNVNDVFIIINAQALDKKSKLRNLFEKEKKLVSTAFYPDTKQILTNIAVRNFREKKITISQQNINLIISKCNGDRDVLNNEMLKIENYHLSKGEISNDIIIKLINLIENHDISDLVDSCLAKNEKKTINILNENNFGNEESVLITRVFLNKAKRLLKLATVFEKNNNISLTISTAKPPIFWKDKETIEKQIYRWKTDNIKNLIYKLTKIELLIKKNINNSTNIISDFIIEQVFSKN